MPIPWSETQGSTRSAKFLVFLLKDKGSPVLVPVNE